MADEKYSVVVGNIGTVYSGDSRTRAWQEYDVYVAMSKGECGRASGESVAIFGTYELLKEYIGDSQVLK